MCQRDTTPWRGRLVPVLTALAGALGLGTLGSAQVTPDWRHIGNSAVDLSLASPASGAVKRVWYSTDGSRLFVLAATGRVFETSDFETWRPSTAMAPSSQGATAASIPGGALSVRVSPVDSSRLYAYGGQVLRSDDGGLSWTNLTAFDRRSIIGGEMQDLTVSPRDGDEIAVANSAGVWRSLDGAVSWTGLNDSLPNLPAKKILAVPRGAAGLRVAAGALGSLEWGPGEKQAWRPVDDSAASADAAARKALSAALGVEITAYASAGDFRYAGSADGRLWNSLDKGRSWTASPATAEGGAVEAIFADAREPGLALAAVSRTTGDRVLRTINGGQFWEGLTANLPEAAVHGVTADAAAGVVYVATERGIFMTHADLNAAGPANPWTALQGLPDAPALDVSLDSGGNQLFVVVEGYGIYAALAPHRTGSPRLINAADFSQRPAAPGSLLSVLGNRVLRAQGDGLTFPVLAASQTETQIQVPFGAHGTSLSLSLETGNGSYQVAVPLEAVSPAIFVDRDGTPLVLNADTGVLLDAMNTAHSNSRLQVLMTGLGQVRPDWPSGVPAPLANAPEVVAPVRAYIDRAPVEVTRAVLAPGYIGLYLIEVQLPPIVNSGPAELYVESEGRESNRVRVWIEP